MMDERLRARLIELESERARFVEAANRQIAGYNGAIGELRRLLEMSAEFVPADAIPPERAEVGANGKARDGVPNM